MTTRNLSALFQPRTIALIGASNQAGSVGAIVARNMFTAGFSGPILPVNPHADEIHTVPSYRSVAALPSRVDLAVLATPPATIPRLVAELGGQGCRAAVVITAGFDEALRVRMLEASRPHLMRIVGPNCLGFFSPAVGINASFAHLGPAPGDMALLTQSGAVATSIIDWAAGRGLGFSHIVSLGDMSDVDFGDLLDYLAFDPATKSILLYAENITHARKFMSAARIAARAKPVIVVKAGRSIAGARAAASHTGALAGADAVYDAAFRRAGILRVDGLRDLFDAAETLASGMRPRGNRLMILTNGGGLGVLATDALERGGGQLGKLSAPARAALDIGLPPSWSHANPVDILGDAQGDRYEAALDVLDKEDADAILVMNCPTGVGDNMQAAAATLKARARNDKLPWLSCWMGDATAEAPRGLLSAAKLPAYETPDEAIRAFLHLVTFAKNQEALLEAPSASAERGSDARDLVRGLIDEVLTEGRRTLTEPEAKSVLTAYGIPTVETVIARSPKEAGEQATRLGGAVALKVLSRQITHKSDVGGVALGLEGSSEVETAAEAMLAAVRNSAPHAVIDGFTVQRMVTRPRAQELILGVAHDETFGSCILFGQGGVATETIADRSVGLPPLSRVLAEEMIARTRVAKLLAGYRDRPPANLGAVKDALLALSDLTVDFPEIAELDINPLLADEEGAVALDARIILRQTSRGDDSHLAIRPYPHGLQREFVAAGVRHRVRPIRPQDLPALLEMAQRADADALRLRFHDTLGQLTPEAAARLTQIDYDREMVMIAIDADNAISGMARLVFEPSLERGEYVVIIPTETREKGVERHLLQALLEYAMARGATTIWGDVRSDNVAMLSLARELGAHLHPDAHAPAITRTEFKL